MWHYGFTSFFNNYNQIDATGEIIVYSIPTVNVISRTLSILMYISCIWLFLYKFAKKRFCNKYEFIYILIVVYMIVILLFFTKNPIQVLTDLGAWNNRMGIITVFGCVLYFYAGDDVYWPYIRKLLCWAVLASTVLVAFFLVFQPEIYIKRLYAYKWLHGFGVVLRLGLWLFIVNNKKSIILNWIVLIIDVVMIIALQARLYIIDFVLHLFFIFALLIINRNNIGKDKTTKMVKRIGIIALCSMLLLGLALLSSEARWTRFLPENVQQSLEMFSERVDEDTRTEQAKGFFEYFWDSFPLGVGYNLDGIPSGVGENGIDCGYLNTMYVTGLPMVVLLVLFTLLPIYKCWFKRNNLNQIVIIARATTWTIILLSSATTALEIEFIFFIICSGRCSGWLRRKKYYEGKESIMDL